MEAALYVARAIAVGGVFDAETAQFGRNGHSGDAKLRGRIDVGPEQVVIQPIRGPARGSAFQVYEDDATKFGEGGKNEEIDDDQTQHEKEALQKRPVYCGRRIVGQGLSHSSSDDAFFSLNLSQTTCRNLKRNWFHTESKLVSKCESADSIRMKKPAIQHVMTRKPPTREERPRNRVHPSRRQPPPNARGPIGG